MKTKQKIFLGLLIVAALGCTANKTAESDDVYDILNTLLKTNYSEAELVVLNLKENKEYYADNEISDSIVGSASEYNEPASPPPSLRYTSYSKYFFTQLYHLKLIDSVDVACMYNQLKSKKTYTLDATRINKKGINLSELQKLNETQNNKQPTTNNYIVMSVPVMSDDNKKALVEIEYHCGALCGSGNIYILEKKAGKWTIIYRIGRWIS